MTQGPGSGSGEPDPDLSSSPPTHAPSLPPQSSAAGASAGWHRNAHLRPQWGRRRTEGYLSWWSSLRPLTASVDKRMKNAFTQNCAFKTLITVNRLVIVQYKYSCFKWHNFDNNLRFYTVFCLRTYDTCPVVVQIIIRESKEWIRIRWR